MPPIQTVNEARWPHSLSLFHPQVRHASYSAVFTHTCMHAQGRLTTRSILPSTWRVEDILASSGYENHTCRPPGSFHMLRSAKRCFNYWICGYFPGSKRNVEMKRPTCTLKIRNWAWKCRAGRVILVHSQVARHRLPCLLNVSHTCGTLYEALKSVFGVR